MATITRQTFTFFATKAQAEALAAVNQAADADSEYRVIENAAGKTVERLHLKPRFAVPRSIVGMREHRRGHRFEAKVLI